jgi:anti-sigma factor ChrR (cupin superfamily)
MDAVTPKTKAEPRSHHVRPANMEWQKTRFAGCEIKTLLFDPESGLVTALTRFAPGAILPDHEHVRIEQTYVIEGRLVDRDGPDTGMDVGPGGLMLAMFQIPNKFYERDGRITDANGQDWESLWGELYKAQA